MLIVMQSLREHEETNEDEIQNTEDSGGCALPDVTTQPNAT